MSVIYKTSVGYLCIHTNDKRPTLSVVIKWFVTYKTLKISELTQIRVIRHEYITSSIIYFTYRNVISKSYI